MVVRTNARQEETAEEQGEELVLVTITYTGRRSLYSANGMRQEGDYPALDGFQGPGPDGEVGESKLVVIPSSSLGWWETHADFELSYAAQDMARTLLEANYLPDEVVGPGYDPDTRERLCEAMGIEPQASEEEWREVLLSVADYDSGEEPEEETPDHTIRARRLVANTDRSVLVKVAGTYDDAAEYAESVGKDSYGHLGQYELAEFLESKEDEEVDRRIHAAETGGSL